MICTDSAASACSPAEALSGSTSQGYVPFADLPDVLTTAQAAAALQVDPKTLRSMIRRGELRAVRCGRLIRVPKTALAEFCGGVR
ncbi:MAG: DNA-binding protein [Coriobacteriaceae bacterium]|jgi:excisionase family DNA binding protein|nr:MAG: DNA-binding protein [Coriobacteriaceae bacterium]